MDISLIICTRNRADVLNDHLNSIEKLSCPVPYEIIFVNNASTDNTSGLLQNYFKKSRHNIIITEEPVVGVSRARNRGIAVSKGNIIAFTDDDCYPDANYLNDIYNCFKAQPDLGYLAGRVLLYDQEDWKMGIQTKNMYEEFGPGSFFIPGSIHGANFSFKREALIDVRGFDEDLGIGGKYSSAEDIDIFVRLSCLGWPGVYNPKPIVYHHHRRNNKATANHVKTRNDEGRGAYMAKCLLVPDVRKDCLVHWKWRIANRPVLEIFREFRAGLKYLLGIQRLKH